VTATSASKYTTNHAVVVSDSFDLTFLNPCTDASFVTITAPTPPTPMLELSYIISSGLKEFAAHPTFKIKTLPIPHTLCGDIAYSATFDGTVVNGDPLDYDSATLKFTADSEDRSLIGVTRSYTVFATLANWPQINYPTAPSVTGSSTIKFVDPCLNPFTFMATA